MGRIIRYLNALQEGITSSFQGLFITFRHLWTSPQRHAPLSVSSDHYFTQENGIVTLEYPYEAIPVPDNGRYRLHNEIDDCIVCDKCAKICPVNCIEIEAIKSTEEIGITSDGTTKRLYAATFDIDMAKCCYCGLCTTVCPTECLTMTPTFDYSEFDVKEMNYHFTDLSPTQAEEKRALYEQKQAEKAASKGWVTKESPNTPSQDVSPIEGSPKPSFKPKFPVAKPANTQQELRPESPASLPSSTENTPSIPQETSQQEAKPKPVFKPKLPVPKTILDPSTSINVNDMTSDSATAPVVPTSPTETTPPSESKPKPVFKPKIPLPKPPETPPIVPSASEPKETDIEPPVSSQEPKPKPVFKPKMKPIIPPKPADNSTSSSEN